MRCSIAAMALCALTIASARAAPDVASGAAVFEAQCADCHSVTPGKNKRGPSLAGVIGRAAGKVQNYRYSDAMMNSGITWTPDRLARYLAAPKTDLPGTKMRLLDKPTPEEVARLIAWLQQQK